jgi:hypothetical protein
VFYNILHFIAYYPALTQLDCQEILRAFVVCGGWGGGDGAFELGAPFELRAPVLAGLIICHKLKFGYFFQLYFCVEITIGLLSG